MNSSTKTDTLFSNYQKQTQAFKFDEAVAEVFQDMIRRSVPGYENIIAMTGVFTQTHVQEDSRCYDLGCSLGASTIAILKNLRVTPSEIVAVDNSQAMIIQAKKNIDLAKSNVKVNVIEEDIRNIKIEQASLVIMNFTLQFIPLPERQQLINNIYQGLMPNGVLLVSEKISFAEQSKQEFFNELHHAFKKLQGYSDLEISQKRNALENVLIPENVETHLNRLNLSGFKTVNLWYQCLNFASFFAVK